MNKVQNLAIGTGSVNMTLGNCTDAFRALDNFSDSVHEFSLTKTVCTEGRKSL
jgi:hypothetical protein